MNTQVKVRILANASFAISLLTLLTFQPNFIRARILNQVHKPKS